jgi:glucose/arabinose dehydrogenase
MKRYRFNTHARSVLAFVFVGITIALPVTSQEVRNRVAARTPSSVGELLLREVVVGLDHPWGVAQLRDGSFLITERPGRLLYVSPSTDEVFPVGGIPNVYVGGQGGLLDVVVHTDGAVYLSHSIRRGLGAATAISTGTLAIDRNATGRIEEVTLNDVETIFTANRSVSGGRHFGSRIVFAPDGSLYATLGDRGNRDMAQDPTNHIGSVIRIGRDGSIPRTNPTNVIDPATGNAITPVAGLFSWGHRNAQGIAVEPQTGEVWLHEHGPRGGDEINVVEAGLNYGWPIVTGGVEYSGREITQYDRREGYASPILEWTPSIAPSGMAFVDAPSIPEWRGDLLVGALVQRHLRRVEIGDDRRPEDQERLFDGFARVRDVRQGTDGSLYLLTDESPNGGLYRIERER